MPRSFAITTSAPSVQLDGSGRGEHTFTVSNVLGRPVRVRAVLDPEMPLPRGWLTLAGDTERELAPDGTQTFAVKLVAPPGAPEGAYAFHLTVVNVDNPDEEFAIGPSVAFHVQHVTLPARKRFPLWIVALAAGVVLITAGAMVAGRLLRDDGPGEGGSGSAPTLFLSFDGDQDFIDLGEPPELAFTGKVTVEAWVRIRDAGSFHNILAHGYTLSPAPGELYLRVLSGNYQVGSWNGLGHGVSARIPPGDVNEWVHLAGVYDGTHWRLYRNGQELASQPDPVGVVAVEAPWAIGARGGGSERFFRGDIAEVRLWNVARSPEQIREDMRRAPKEDEPGLVGYWPLSEGRGAIAGDRSRSQSHGVLRGATWGTP